MSGNNATRNCGGCLKCIRHPGEGYICYLHPIGKTELDRVARGLITEWERVEPQEGPVNVSRVATFVDLARLCIQYARIYDYEIDGKISDHDIRQEPGVR